MYIGDITQKGYDKKKKKLEAELEEVIFNSLDSGTTMPLSSASGIATRIQGHKTTNEALQALFGNGGQSTVVTLNSFNLSRLSDARKNTKLLKKKQGRTHSISDVTSAIDIPTPNSALKPSTSAVPKPIMKPPRLVCPKPVPRATSSSNGQSGTDTTAILNCMFYCCHSLFMFNF